MMQVFLYANDLVMGSLSWPSSCCWVFFSCFVLLAYSKWEKKIKTLEVKEQKRCRLLEHRAGPRMGGHW